MNTSTALKRFGRGAAVGTGAIIGGRLQDRVAQRESVGPYASAGVGLVVGLGGSVGPEFFMDTSDGLVSEAVEYVSYGVQGSSWQNIGEAAMSEQATSARGEVIEVSAQATSESFGNAEESEEMLFSVDA
jgi:hypothetical protein